jgi:hypothetical protein
MAFLVLHKDSRRPRRKNTGSKDSPLPSLGSKNRARQSGCIILGMNVRDFRRIALSFEGAEESSHMGQPDFRVGGRIFATLASAKQGFGNLMLTLEQQQAFVDELPDVFLPIPGGWGRMGMTHIRLAAASEDVLTGALQTAWKLRVDKNGKSQNRPGARKKSNPARPARRKR